MIEEQKIIESDFENNNNINNQEKDESSFENLFGEEEDEDDLLKDETETNKSSIDNNNNVIKDKKENEENNNNNKDDNNKETSDIKRTISKNVEEKSIESDIIKDSIELYKERIREKESKKNIENSDENEEGEEIEDEENEESEEVSKKPYDLYCNSKISFTNFFHELNVGDIIYDIKQNIYLNFIEKMPLKKHNFLFIKDNITKANELKKEINDLFIKKLENKEDENTKREFCKYIKEKLDKSEIIMINEKDIKEYTLFKKVKIHYLNYFNKKRTFEIIININWKLNEFVDYIIKLYHIPDIDNNSNLILFIKNKQYSGKEIEKNDFKLFLPHNFNYQNDYIIIIEKENIDKLNLDLGSSIDKYNFKTREIPHIIYCSYFNFCLESILVSNQLKDLECQIYQFYDGFNLNLEPNIGKYNYENAKKILTSNWNSQCKYITSIKSIRSSTYKNNGEINEEVVSFSINPKINLYHDKTYVFLIKTPTFNINIFESGATDQGIFIVSSDNKNIINGFICKKLSDFCVDN